MLFLLFLFVGCTVASLPTEGIWYNEELKLLIDFDQMTVCSSDESLKNLDLDLRCWIDGGIDIFYLDEQGNEVDIYVGFGRYINDRFAILLYSKANPDDLYGTPIEVNNEKYVFTRVENHDGINK